ncbi:tyrosine-type recombinase/integrase [Phascolarctobacterium sp.]
MLPDFVTDTTKIAKYSYADVEEIFLDNYEEVLKKYIAGGNPSQDTEKNYFGRIREFLSWCKDNDFKPLRVQEQHIILYRDFLLKNNQKVTTIAAKLTAIRKFYHLAQKFHLIQNNPAEDVKAPRDPDAALIDIPYLSAGKLEYLFHSIPNETEKELRDKVIIAFMAIEGLRTVEIHRMNEEDINVERQTILVHGKGKNAMIYPRPDTFALLMRYLESKDRFRMHKYKRYGTDELTPVFTSTSNNMYGHRMIRQAVRDAVNKWLTMAGLKEKGRAGHMLRHTCATLLYKETKDLKQIQETLRHSNINMSSKYAHLTDRQENRYTNSIPVELE